MVLVFYPIDRQPQGPHGIPRLQVFCFLVKEERTRELSRRLNLITGVFSFSSCVGGIVHLKRDGHATEH